jgi:pimeloyl-ACP methyl ester carboxylesterase
VTAQPDAPQVPAGQAPEGIAGAETLRLPGFGVDLHAVAAGPPGGPVVFLLHGFPEFWWAWRRQIGPLAAAGLRVVAPDLRGYNLSAKPRDVAAYALDTAAEDVPRMAEALGRDRFAVVGHDWGALIAWHLAARGEPRLERAAILNGPHPAALSRFLASHPWQVLRLSYFAAFQVPLLPETVLRAGNFAALAGAMRATAGTGSFTAAELARYRAAWARPGALAAMLNWYRAALRHRPRIEERRIATPIRIIWGDRDIALDARLAEAGQALCEQAEVFHLPDATHWLHHDRPEDVNRLLLDFLLA